MPILTVSIPTYNRQHTILRAINSVLGQACTDIELLVIDDGSTDQTSNILSGINDSRLRVMTLEVNKGVAACRNLAVRNARGKYIAWLDSDDWSLPDRFRQQLDYLEDNQDIALAGTWVMQSRNGIEKRIKRRPVDSDEIAASLLFGPSIDNTSTMARTSILQEFEFDESRSHGEDYEQWARMLIAGYRLANMPIVMTVRNKDGDDRLSNIAESRQCDACRPIYDMLLRNLGLEPDLNDLNLHHHLRCNGGFRPDRNYLEWAEKWLSSLRDANRVAGWVPTEKFDSIVGQMWLKLCWKGKPRTSALFRLAGATPPAAAARKHISAFRS